MKSLSQNKDIDRKILSEIDNDTKLLELCSLNKYFFYQVCDEIFFQNRLIQKYPQLLLHKQENETWKDFYLKILYYVSKLKEDFDFISESNNGNPIIQYAILKKFKKIIPERFFELVITYNEIDIIKYVKERYNIIFNIYANIILNIAVRENKYDIVKYLLDEAEVSSAGRNNNLKSFEIAAKNGNVDIFKTLYDYLPVNLKNSFNKYLFMQYAKVNGHKELYSFLDSLP